MLPTRAVDLIDAEDTSFAQALRAALEYFGTRVCYHPIAEAKDLVAVLGGKTPLSGCIVLACHGVKRGLCLPELAPQLEAKQPYRKVLTPANLREFLRLPSCLVINTGCLLGRPPFANAFLESGCRTYIGPSGYPEGDAALFYVLHFFYEYHCRGRSIRDSHALASTHDKETGMYKLYQRGASQTKK